MYNKTMFVHAARFALAVMIALAVLAAAAPKPAQAGVCEENYTVKAGDTIYKISKKFDVTVYKIARANNMDKPYVVTPGEDLCIPKTPAPSSNYTWSAALKNGKVSVEGDKFKKSWPLFVKVREDVGDPWYKLGKVVTSKQGELEKTYTLPKGVNNAKVLYVCLKDGVTNYLDCKRVVKQ